MELYAIEASGIKKGFDGIPVLKDVSFRLKRGEVHAIVGQNGAGKSTLVKLLNGFHGRDGGEVLLLVRADEADVVERKDEVTTVPTEYDEKASAASFAVNCVRCHGASGDGLGPSV